MPPRSRPRRLYFSLASTTIERPSGVSSESEASCAALASRSWLTSGAGMNSVAWRLPSVMVPVLSSSSVFTSPAASTARPLMASTLYCTRRSMPAMPMAESNPPMVVGMRHTSSETSTKTVCGALRVDGERLQRYHRQQKDDGEAGEQNAEGDFVRRLLARGAFDQRDHAIEKSFSGIRGDLYLDPVRKHLGAAGNGRAVAAGFANHGSRLAGDCRLIDRRHAFDHFAVARDVVAGRNVNHISGAKQNR